MRLVFLLASVTTVMTAGTGQGFSGSFSQGNGQGFGYGGSFGSGSDSGSSSGGSPQGFPTFNFNNLLDQYFQVFTKLNQDLGSSRISAYSYSITNADSNSKAMAKSSITFDRKGLQNQQNAFAAGGYGFPGGYPAFASGGYGGGGSNYAGQGIPSFASGGYGGGFSNFGGQASSAGGYPSYGSGGYGGGFSNYGGQGASASASIGPGGSHQTASVYPENPTNPNVNNRFGATSPEGSSYGVFTSSQSVSSNIDGKPTSHHTAQTTINDNGKVTSYTVHNP